MRSLAILALVCFFSSVPDDCASQDYFQQFVHYTIHVRLDTERHMLYGSETILYKNNSPDTLRKFLLHLYPNAYQSRNSAFMKDFGRAFNFSLIELPEKYRGYLKISGVSVDGEEVTHEVDDTIAMIDLPSPLPPGEKMEVSLTFEEKIRRHMGRAGYKGKHYDFAQWYPKVVVYDENGFHADKFMAGEFYGEFGNFDVFIDVPEDYVIAATGVVKSGDPGWTLNPPGGKDGRSRRRAGSEKGERRRKTVHFHAEHVHDFAWSCDPTFVVQDSTWNGTEIRSFYRKENKDWKDSTLVHGVRAIRWLNERVGPYPYPQVSIVDALLRGGMEYPMLVMNGRVSETLVLHEIGHIYFYGILANDERAEAWLDEGFTTFQTDWYVLDRYGSYGITRDRNWYQRLTPQYPVLALRRYQIFPLLRQGYGERIATRAENFNNDYYAMVYRKTALMLSALRYVVGDENFEKILKQYYEEWKFKHVNEARFKKICETVSGMNLDAFFEQWLYTTKLCDYRLEKMKSTPNADGKGFTVDVTIERRGEMVMPLSLEIELDDGRREEFRVDGRLRTIQEKYQLPRKPRRASLNGKNEIMDLNLSDNFIPRRRALQIDWPNNDYYPESAYQIRYRPGIWYNEIDGFKAGLRLRGSYMNWFRRLSLGIYYGVKSERVDFSASYVRPVQLFGGNGSLSMSGYKMEGRQDGTLSLFLRRRKELIRPPSQDFEIGINYHELINFRFLENDETYQANADVAPFFAYTVDPQFDVFHSKLSFDLRAGRKWFGGRHEYSRFSASGTLDTRRELVPVDAKLRLFVGFSGGRVPFQQKFYLAGGGPLAEERRFYLRSPGAIPEDLHYHEPGHGNLRGYFEGDFGVNRLAALNFEFGSPLPMPGISKITRKIFGEISAVAFADVGTSFDKDNPIGSSPRVEGLVNDGILDAVLFDAGFGVRLKRNYPFYNMHLRADFPLYVNHPEINGERDEFRFRYLLSLSSSF